ncbi:MAG: GGDEF domain-containing response regulator [Planctomycetota bacterium]|jgi:diguanylate cyclase (GGDEF)-like protein
MNFSATDSGPVTLVVGDRALAGLLESGRGAVVSVDHYLDALGEMGRYEVAAVIGRLDPMASSLEATVRALRELGNGVRLILVVDAAQEVDARRAVTLGYDDYVVRPFEENHIWAALSGQPIEHDTPDEEAVTVESAEEVPAEIVEAGAEVIEDGAPPVASGQPKIPENVAKTTDRGPTMAPGKGQGPDPIVQEPLLPSECEHLLGDVDLVEQLLRDRSGLKARVLRLMSQRLGGDGLSWSAEPPEEVECCEVKFGGKSLGYLSSETVESEQLKVYAAWMARWLMLERQLDYLNEMALKDDLTGVWNRRYFKRFLSSTLNRAKQERFRVTLMIYDIDDFKDYNDAYGHAAGDEILRETAKLMTSVIRDHDIVARIGGDEFAVIFWDAEESRKADSEHPQTVRDAAKRFRKAICEHRFPKLADEAPGTLTISGGLASFPWDGATVEELMELADRMLLESKGKGKNAMTFGPGAMRLCNVDDNGEEG